MLTTAQKYSVNPHSIIKDTKCPFGMLERSYSDSIYRFGFNGKENDNEILGNGRWQDYGQRLYRPDLIRFFTPDPLIVYQKKYPELSSYQFASNTPIMAIDMDGLERAVVILSTTEDNKTLITVITNRNVIEAFWQDLSKEHPNVEWIEGELRYKYYAKGSETYPYYPSTLAKEGILIMDVRNPDKTTLSYVGWEEDNRRNRENSETQIIETIRATGQVLEFAGVVIEVVAVAGAVVTEGGTLVAVPVGEGAATAGVGLQIAADVMEGDLESAALTAALVFLTHKVVNRIGKAAKSAIKVEADQKWIKEYVEKKITSTEAIIESGYQYNKRKKEKNKSSNEDNKKE